MAPPRATRRMAFTSPLLLLGRGGRAFSREVVADERLVLGHVGAHVAERALAAVLVVALHMEAQLRVRGHVRLRRLVDREQRGVAEVRADRAHTAPQPPGGVAVP